MIQPPRNVWDNLRYRARLSRAAAANRRFREAVLDECRHDPLFYINAFAWTFQPGRMQGSVVPFLTYPVQDRALRTIVEHIQGQRDLVIEKSREMGASWLCVMTMEWFWHFHRRLQFLMVSRVQDLVDSSSPDSLFWKVRFLHQYLPEWLLERDDYDRKKNFYEHRRTRSTMTGVATTASAGVGGRATGMFIDEFSRIPDDVELRDATRDTAKCRIFNSTHYGSGTAFNGLCTNGVTDKLVMHWSEHPEKGAGLYRFDPEANRVEVLDKSYSFPASFDFELSGRPSAGPYVGIRSPWYDAECKIRSTKNVAENLDINPAAGSSQYFDPLVIARLVRTYCRPADWTGDIQHDEQGKFVSLSSSPAGRLLLWCKLLWQGRPKPSVYVVAGDLSTGSGATPSCLSVMECTTGTKVAEYANAHLEPSKFAYYATALCYLFAGATGEPAKLIWEHQGPGCKFAKTVMDDLGYRNVYYLTRELPRTMDREMTTIPGWSPTPENTMIALDEYRGALEHGNCLNPSEKAVLETLHFRYSKDGRTIEHDEVLNKEDPSGSRMNHGDRVVADMLAWKLVRESGEQKRVERQKQEPVPGSLEWRRAYHKSRMSQDEEPYLLRRV